MNTRKLLFIGITVCVVILILFLFLIFSFVRSGPATPTPIITPGVTGFVNQSKLGLQMISSTPVNRSSGVPVNTVLVANFNKDIPEAVVTVSPPLVVASTASGRTLTIRPSTALLPSTTYTVTMQLGDQTFFLIFTTVGPTPTSGPDTRDPGLVDEENNKTKEEQPDTYLSNYTPYSDANFSVTSDFAPSIGQFQFTVTTKTGSSIPGQTAFTTWAKKQGLNDSQVSRVSVVYK